VSVDDFQGGNGLDGAQVDLLPDRQAGIGGTGLNFCREVLDPGYLVLGEKELAEPGKIEPFVRGILKSVVVKIETIHVDGCVHRNRMGAMLMDIRLPR